MSVYIVGLLKVRSWEWLAEYAATTERLVARHGGVYLGRAVGMEMLEGEAEPPSGLVMLEFPSEEQARAWHADPEYQPMIELRRSGSDTQLMLARGLAP
jgi:uncharacterized protein (DUF1330 family)